ncbi:uncharacterized protein K452DRAFT_313703 [Aplosporella prunicola CBS 121167]|uniref:Heterokaryon incompatibility domain-containing protein n=1 Tax=Aplosporella prunicola CBS 121167 TaxID=1176127 RepID=A0A6A6AVU6_9PEZI|nr:uncharacterized protein K452DRAFT_313703 [Aplosporella prunicola CBS 121167]KAF2135820.1 hypothetical protein K452DRAFT_313703 [Aplosporella prunicola CBS 121167]
MSRSWTYQEGVLARSCVYQFSNSAVDPANSWSTPSRHRFQPVESVHRALYNPYWENLHQDWKNCKYNRLHFWIDCRMKRWTNQSIIANVVKITGQRGRLEQFVRSWNELAGRSTTMIDDIHVVVANLLDFHAGTIISHKDQQSRMKAMILSFDLLPFSLFYNTGPRLGQHIQHKNRWIPLGPSKSQLTMSPTVKLLHGVGELLLEDDSKSLQIFLITGLVGIERFKFYSPMTGDMFLVQPQLPDSEGYQFSSEGIKLIVLEGPWQNPTSSKIRGACFQVVQSEGLERNEPDERGNSPKLRLIFEFPLEITPTGEEGEYSRANALQPKLYTASVVSPACQLLIQYGKHLLPQISY